MQRADDASGSTRTARIVRPPAIAPADDKFQRLHADRLVGPPRRAAPLGARWRRAALRGRGAAPPAGADAGGAGRATERRLAMHLLRAGHAEVAERHLAAAMRSRARRLDDRARLDAGARRGSVRAGVLRLLPGVGGTQGGPATSREATHPRSSRPGSTSPRGRCGARRRDGARRRRWSALRSPAARSSGSISGPVRSSRIADLGGGANAALLATDGGFLVTQNGGIDFTRTGLYADPPPYRPVTPGLQRVAPDGAVTYVSDDVERRGVYLAPNDLVAAADGTLWFTDPPQHPPPPEPLGRVHTMTARRHDERRGPRLRVLQRHRARSRRHTRRDRGCGARPPRSRRHACVGHRADQPHRERR